MSMDVDENKAVDLQRARERVLRLRDELASAASSHQRQHAHGQLGFTDSRIDLPNTLRELAWLQTLNETVASLLTLWQHAVELERVVRTAHRIAAKTASPEPDAEEEALLARGVQQVQRLVAELRSSDSAAAALGRAAPGAALPAGLQHVRDGVAQKLQSSVATVRARWDGGIKCSLADCGWPPPLTAPKPRSPGPQPPGARVWEGFQALSPQLLHRVTHAFVCLTQLQLASGQLPGGAAAAAGRDGAAADEGLAAPGVSPWCQPELWATRALADAPVNELSRIFMAGGPLDRLDAPHWLFQAAASACETLPPTVAGLQAALESMGLGGVYVIEFELVRSVHAALAELLLARWLPRLLEGEPERGAVKPPALEAWLHFADAVTAFERQMLQLMACELPEDVQLVDAALLEGSILTRVCDDRVCGLRDAWWRAEQFAASQAVDAVVDAAASWHEAPDFMQEEGEAAVPAWRREWVYSVAAREVELLVQATFARCLWVGSVPWRILMTDAVVGAALRECLKVLVRLAQKALAYDDLLAPHWLQQVCCYVCTARVLEHVACGVRDSPAFASAASDSGAVAESLASLSRPPERDAAAPLRDRGGAGGVDLQQLQGAAVAGVTGALGGVSGALGGVRGALGGALTGAIHRAGVPGEVVTQLTGAVGQAQGKVWQGISGIGRSVAHAAAHLPMQSPSLPGAAFRSSVQSHLASALTSTLPSTAAAAPGDARSAESASVDAATPTQSGALDGVAGHLPLQQDVASFRQFWRSWTHEVVKAIASRVGAALAQYPRARPAANGASPSGAPLSPGVLHAVELLSQSLEAASRQLDRVAFRELVRGVAAELDRLLARKLALKIHPPALGVSEFAADGEALIQTLQPYTPRPATLFKEFNDCLTLLRSDSADTGSLRQQSNGARAAAAVSALGITNLSPELCAKLLSKLH